MVAEIGNDEIDDQERFTLRRNVEGELHRPDGILDYRAALILLEQAFDRFDL